MKRNGMAQMLLSQSLLQSLSVLHSQYNPMLHTNFTYQFSNWADSVVQHAHNAAAYVELMKCFFMLEHDRLLQGATALHCAAFNNTVVAANWLLSCGATPDAQDCEVCVTCPLALHQLWCRNKRRPSTSRSVQQENATLGSIVILIVKKWLWVLASEF